jgi:hypothetical protein
MLHALAWQPLLSHPLSHTRSLAVAEEARTRPSSLCKPLRQPVPTELHPRAMGQVPSREPQQVALNASQHK